MCTYTRSSTHSAREIKYYTAYLLRTSRMASPRLPLQHTHKRSKNMLQQARTDAPYWGEAFLYAIHTQNLLPTIANMGKAPAHAWTGHLPDTTHLHPFGSTAYADVIRRDGRGVLEVASVRCRMLGWWMDKPKGYKLEDPTTRLLIASR